MPSKLEKKELRQKFKKLLDDFSFEALVTKSARLRSQFFQNLIEPHQQLLQNRYCVSFYPLASEPQLNIESEQEPYRVAYVRIEDWAERKLLARAARRDQPGQWEEFSLQQSQQQTIKIFQPAVTQAICLAEEIALILVPGLAFTEVGLRLGRGAGFYDRFLQQYPAALRVGLAYHEQVVSSLPGDEWDQAVDIILTDEGIFKTNRFQEWQLYGRIERQKVVL